MLHQRPAGGFSVAEEPSRARGGEVERRKTKAAEGLGPFQLERDVNTNTDSTSASSHAFTVGSCFHSG